MVLLSEPHDPIPTSEKFNLNFTLKYSFGAHSAPPPLKVSSDFFKSGMTPKIISKQVEYEKYWYIISQYEWYNGIFARIWFSDQLHC